MTKHQTNIVSTILFLFITLFRSYDARNPFSDLDLNSQTLNPVATGFKITGNAANSFFGNKVSSAGDVDNDGYDDIIIGAYGNSGSRGAVYVIYGGPQSSFLDIDFSTTSLSPLTTGFTITGSTASDQVGWSVSAGDIDNDGYDDIIIGARGVDSSRGAAYVVYGGARSTMSNMVLSPTALNPASTGFTITGSAFGDEFGYTVSTAGDINNDGFDDIVVGIPFKNSNQGFVYVIYGGLKSTMSNIALSTQILDPPTTGFMITGNAANDRFGFSIGTAGDINNDNYDDIIVGAYQKTSSRGAAYVIYGGPKATMANILLSSPLNPGSTGFMITGNTAGDQFGISVSTAGDINNDSYDDIIVGADTKSGNKGAAYVIYGGPKATRANIVLSSPLDPGSTGFMITGNAASDSLGHAVSTAEDINKDGYDDIIVGAYGKSSSKGAAYVIYGGPMSSMSNWDFSSGATLNPSTTGFMITGNAAGDQFGWALSQAKDINKDGYPDILVGAPGRNSYQGLAYVIYASCSANCKQCSSENVCTQCQTSYLLYQDKCVASCPEATFADTATTCTDCSANCKVCTSTIVCTQCKSSYLMYQDKCYAPCPDTTFADTATTCADCSANCKVCTSTTACTQCEISYLMYQSECYASCPDTTFANTATTCADCSVDCNHCSSSSVCTECQSPSLLYQSKCLSSCPDATLATSTTCEDCPTHCKHCSTTSVCTECKSSYILYQDGCIDSCPDGTFLSTSSTCQSCQSPCSKCTSLSECTECTSLLILYETQCLISCPKTMFNFNGVCTDCPSFCYSCTSQDSCQVCYEGYTLSNSRCVLPSSNSSSSSLHVQEKATQTISSAAQGVGSVISVGSSIVPFSSLVSKIVQNTRYMNLSVTTELADVYQTWKTDIISWDVPNVMSDLDHFKISPPLFARYNIGSPFLVNFWPTLVNIGGGLTIFVICFVLQGLLQKAKYKNWVSSLVQKLVAGSFNFTLIQAYACMDDILFYLVIDAKTNPFNSSFSWSSLISAGLFLALGCLLVFFNLWTIKKYQSIKGSKALIEAFNERNKYWELFYSDFNDDTLLSQSFFAVQVIRSALSSLIIAVFYDYPLMQTLYLMTLDGVITLFLYFKTPFNTLRGKLAQYYFEIITLLVHICTFSLSLQDFSSSSSDTDTLRRISSTAIIYLNTALLCGAIGFMFIEIYKTISQKIRAAKCKQYETIAIQTGTQDVLSTGTEIQRRRGNDVEASSSENLHFFQGISQTDQSGPNLLESNFNVEDSKELDTEPTRDQSTAQLFVRRRLRVHPRPQKE